MKINGQTIQAPSEAVLYLPHGDTVFEFKAQSVPDFEEFDALVPLPKPPGKRTREGFIPNTSDPGYLQILANYAAQREAWFAIRSLEPSNIEWDTVKPDNPSTWIKWKDDMKLAGFNVFQISRIQNLVYEANCLDEQKIARARDLFLQGKAAASDAATSPSSEPASTPSGEPAAA